MRPRPYETKPCQWCGKHFGRPRTFPKGSYRWLAFDQARYCSRPCYHRSLEVTPASCLCCEKPAVARGRCDNHYRQARYREEPAVRTRVLVQAHSRREWEAAGSLTATEWQEVLDEFEGLCAYCGSSERITMDHVVPRARGGAHAKENVVPACDRCNKSKHTRLLSEWEMTAGAA